MGEGPVPGRWGAAGVGPVPGRWGAPGVGPVPGRWGRQVWVLCLGGRGVG